MRTSVKRLLLTLAVAALASTSAAGAAPDGAATVHPFLPVGGKVALATIPDGPFGESVALSSDGSTALIGNAAAATVMTRSGSTWSKSAQLTLAGVDPNSLDRSGVRVALSTDGTTALVGGSGGSKGAVWVFVRSGNTWAQQAKLTVAGSIDLGTAVALSADGNVALAGGARGTKGSAWIFTRSGSHWSQRSELTGSDFSPGPSGVAVAYGKSVALSGDGRTAIVGDDFDGSGTGAAWVFTGSGGSWHQQGPKLAGDSDSYFGTAAALSADGNIAFVGAEGDDATWVYTRSGATWARGQKLEGLAYTVRGRPNGGSWFGSSVALSADAGTALIGSELDSGGHGTALVFARTGSTWHRVGGRLPNKTNGAAHVGSDVALSTDGTVALVGAPSDGIQGSAWFYAESGTTVPTAEGPGPLPAGAIAWTVHGGVRALTETGSSIAYQGDFDCGVTVRRLPGGASTSLAEPITGQYTDCGGYGGGMFSNSDLGSRANIAFDGTSVVWLDRISVGTVTGSPGGSTPEVVLLTASLASPTHTRILARALPGGYFVGLAGADGMLALNRLALHRGAIKNASLDTVSGGGLKQIAGGSSTLFVQAVGGGLIAALGRDGRIRLFGTTGRLVKTLDTRSLAPRSIALSGGTLALIGKGNKLTLYSTANWKARTIRLAVGADNLALSGGRAVYSARNRVVHVLDLATGRDRILTTAAGDLVGLQVGTAGVTYAWNSKKGDVGWVVFKRLT